MYWTGSKTSKPCKENWDVCKAVFSNRPFQGFDRRNDEKAAAYPVCRLPVYYIEGQRISQYRLDGSIERDAGHIVQYLRIRGCSGLYIQPHCPYFNFPTWKDHRDTYNCFR